MSDSPNPKLLEALEGMVEAVRAGELVAVAAAVVMKDADGDEYLRTLLAGTVDSPTTVLAAAGALEVVKADVLGMLAQQRVGGISEELEDELTDLLEAELASRLEH